MTAVTAFEGTTQTNRVDVTGTSANLDLGVAVEQVTIWNTGSVGVFVRPANASTTAVLPTVGTPQTGFFVPPGQFIVQSVRGMRHFAMIALSSGTATVYIQGGEGL